MRRAALVVVAMLVPALGLADDQHSVERLVKGHVASLAKKAKDDQLGLAKDAIAIVYGAMDVRGALSDARGGPSGTIAHAPGEVEIGVDSDHGVAWFQVPFSVDITPKGKLPGDPSLFHTKERFGGVAVLGKDGWQLAAVMYERLIDDALLAQLGKDHNDALPAGDPKLTGDKGLGGVVAGWIKNGFAAHAATDERLIAGGTSPAEYQAGDAAKTLAKTWDGLKLRAATIDSRTYADGAVGYSRVRVAMPIKTGGAVEMVLAVTVIWQEKEWRWVSVQFSGTHF